MTDKDIIEWYSDIKQISWIFPENSRTVNLMEEDEPEVVEYVTEVCDTCFCKEICFEQLCKDGAYRKNHKHDFLQSPICEEYINAEEVNSVP